MALGCKPSDASLRRFESFPVHHILRMPAGIAQLVEHQPSKLRVAGSNPVSRSINLEIGAAQVAQQAEHLLGKEEVIGSNPILSSTFFLNK